jgi:hypothetical protein
VAGGAGWRSAAGHAANVGTGSANTVNGFSSADDAHAAKNVGKINATNGATRIEDYLSCSSCSRAFRARSLGGELLAVEELILGAFSA